MNRAAEQWARELSQWAVPQHILGNTPRRPYVFTPSTFAAPPAGSPNDSVTNRLAADALPDGGTVLDVGCGGGAAAFALVPKAAHLIGTDRQPDMIELFLRTAAERQVSAEGVIGSWPDVATDVGAADVAVCRNVVYNAADIVAFGLALDRHTRNRVVIELTQLHPQHVRRPLWKHFWDLDRPAGPTAETAAAALADARLPVTLEPSLAPEPQPLTDDRRELNAEFWTRQLCLPTERQAEVAELLIDVTFPRERMALWWDVDTRPGRGLSLRYEREAKPQVKE